MPESMDGLDQPADKSATAKEASSPNRSRKQKRKTALTALAVLFIIIGIFYLFYWLIWGRFYVYTDDAYVHGNIVSLMPQVPGTVTDIYADDTDLVFEGQPVIKLDRADMEIALEQAKANLAVTVRSVRQLFENAEQAQSLLISSKADLIKARSDNNRRVGLINERAISKESLQHFQTAERTTEGAYLAALHRYIGAYGMVGNTYLYDHPDVEKAKAAVRKAYLDLVRTTVLAPVTGYVAKRNVNVGQQVNMQAPMMSIIPLIEVWVDANYKESQLSGFRIGQPVTLYADAFPKVTYHGKIAGLNVGTGAAFAILPPQNATGNWIKIVQRLPVKVALDQQEIVRHPLFIGLSMRVTVDISDRSGPLLPQAPRKKAVFTTPIFNNQLGDADKVVASILKENAPNLSLSLNPELLKAMETSS